MSFGFVQRYVVEAGEIYFLARVEDTVFYLYDFVYYIPVVNFDMKNVSVLSIPVYILLDKFFLLIYC